MLMNKSTAEKPKGKKRAFRIVFLLVFIAAVLTAVYIRVNPKWKAAELTIEPANRFFEIQSLNPDGTTLETRIVPPEGYTRVPVENGSFGEYLRKYPLLPDDIKLPVFDGSTINSSDVAAVFDISLGDDGYQQCADSVIRLYSDYFYETGQFDKISFMFSNGDVCDYNRWKKGKRMLAFADYSFEIPAAFPDSSEQQYRNYLKEVMRYAGTLSLQKESKVISPDELRTGDIICNDVHVVMIVGEAVNENGEKCYLIGQSFIPAVCFHIITKTEGKEVTPWFTQEYLSKDFFTVGSFPFNKNDIRRWKDGF
ncbi:MAG: DUF4846 domain-containing protein [Ruminococcus sp.]|nr:DUF4846 domain-containing protein [Ruminococcus sp.]